MYRAFLLVAVAISVAWASEETENRWDIAEGISGAAYNMKKAEGHEETLRQAYNKLHADEKKWITNPTTPNRPKLESMHKPPAIVMGLQYPDMPIGGPNTQQLGDDVTSPTHANVATFGTLFKLAASSGARNSFISQTHFGCLQFWHAMVPEPFVQVAKGVKKYRVWKNKDLSALIKNGARRIWNVAASYIMKGNKNMAEFHLGRIIHTIGDSFAAGHAFRDGFCGPIVVFMEYNAQKGNHAHDEGDKPALNKEKFACAVERIFKVLQYWAKCVQRKDKASCGYPAHIIDAIFNIHPDVANNDAGGAIEKFKSPTLKEADAKTFTYGGKPIKVYFPPQGTLQRVAGTSSVADVCRHFK